MLDSLRRGILRLASFAGFGDEPCAVGDLRTFDRDTANDSRRMLGEFEQLVASYGAFESLDNPTGRALLRAVMRLETGGPGPRWDVLTGDAPRAFNPVLPTRLYDVNKKQCVPMMGTVPDGVVLPLVTNFTPPRDSGAVQVDVGYGAEGMNSLRNLFFARHQNDTTAVLHDARVTAHAIWQDYALVSVLREAEARGVIPIEGKMTGAVYAFHRVDGEWRLLAFAKNW